MPYLFAAYAIVWLMLFGYVFSLVRRRRQVMREAESVTQALQESDSGT